LEIVVRTPDGAATPARITVLCEDICPYPPTSQEQDVTFEYLPQGWAAVAWAGVDGKVSLGLVPGDYRVVVSRGMEWSVWPPDASQTNGFAVSLSPDEPVRLEAEIARVLDTTGALSADFHVHAIGSQDSSVPQIERVLSFLAEGVDVIVSTDHDIITDYAPAIEALGAGEEIRSIIGNEVTTSILGHFNAFPLVRDPDHRRGGALDWGAGGERVMTPAEIFAWARSWPGEQVVQINHPNFSIFTYADVLRGLSYGDPVLWRIDVPAPDPATGDTGLWSDDFTALEVMNGHSLDRFWGTARWWLTLVGRGHTPTATAVTDTHRRYSNTLGGVPRTFIFVPEETDTPASFELASFVAAVNQGTAVGTNGPFLRVRATAGDGQGATLGEVISTGGEPVEVEIVIEHADWMRVDHLDVYMNVDDVITLPGEFEETPLIPTQTHALVWNEEDIEVVASGLHEHRRYRKTITVTLESAVDAYVIFIVRSDESNSMFSVVPGTELGAFAFTNPLYLDADGGGYDNPHLAELARTPPPYVAPLRSSEKDKLTDEDIEKAFEGLHCSH
ncbi:MAG: CehA/McbA family metallohydrolase, partial [Bradymonadaceae bacterium]